MDDLALKSLIDCLGGQRSGLVQQLTWWNWLVAVGVVCELAFIFWDHFEDFGDWKYAHTQFKIRFPSRPNRLKLLFEILSVVAVAGGIVGELVAESKLGDLDNRIQDANNQRVALLQKESDSQRLRAADLIKQAEDERLARIQLEASVAWRRLSDQQKSDLGARLRHRHDSQVVSVWFLSGDAEGSNFAADIAEMLRDANLRTLPPRPMSPQMQGKRATTADPIDRWMTGVEVESTNDAASVSLADALVKELNAAGFDAQTFGSSDDAPKSLAKDLGPNILVSVAPRPKGPQGEYKLQVMRDAERAKNKANGAHK